MKAAAAALVAAALVLPAAGCAGRHAPVRGPQDRDVFGIYRASVDRGDAGSRSFRLMLHAAPPDRLHAEIYGPGPGGPAVIFDSGGGRICVSVPSERTAYVGEGGASVLERVVSIRLDPAGAVRAILYGDPLPSPITVSRRADRTPGLPQRLVVSGPAGTLRLTRKAIRPLRGDPAALGTAIPPPGFTVLPLEAWGEVPP